MKREIKEGGEVGWRSKGDKEWLTCHLESRTVGTVGGAAAAP